MVTLALVSVGLVNGVQVRSQADLARAHLCDDRADGSGDVLMRTKEPFSGPDPESEEFSAMLGRFPGSLPPFPHPWVNDRFSSCHQDSQRS